MRLRSLVVVTCLVLLGGCAAPDYQRVSLSEDPSEAAPVRSGAPRNPPLRVAIASFISPQATFDAYGRLLDYLATKLGRQVELVQRGTYAEINDLIRSGDAVVGFVCGGAYVEGERQFGMDVLAVPEVHRQRTYYTYIIVPQDSKAKTMLDLRNGNFAYSDPLSNSGHLAAIWHLLELKEAPERFFSSASFMISQDNSIRAVAGRVVDGAAVDGLVYEHVVARSPAYGTQTRVIERLGPYDNPPVVVHPDLEPRLKETLRALFLDMANDPAGRAALAPLRIDRFVRPDIGDYDLVRVMAALVRGWIHGD